MHIVASVDLRESCGLCWVRNKVSCHVNKQYLECDACRQASVLFCALAFLPFVFHSTFLPVPSRDSVQIRGHIAAASPPFLSAAQTFIVALEKTSALSSLARRVPCVFTARRLHLFIPSSSRVELM